MTFKESDKKQKEFACVSFSNPLLWYCRLGHLNRKAMAYLQKMADGLDGLKVNETPCEICLQGSKLDSQ